VDQAPELPEHFFRHQFGRLVASLTRRFGRQHLELCEDAAQEALMRAVVHWSKQGMADDKGAWLYRVASHIVLDGLRAHKRWGGPSEPVEAADDVTEGEAAYFQNEVADDLLRLLFVCADPVIPRDSRLVLALRTLCGFSTEEIARRLFQTEAAIYKRLQRAHATLRETPVVVDTPDARELAERLPDVLHTLYLLFNEGYSSAEADSLIRRELCEEAVRLTTLLAAHPVGASPATDALLALMYLHGARFEARTDGSGGLLILEEQDRTRWDRELINLGLGYLRRSTGSEGFSRYHIEAAIAVEHCLAPSFARTRWDEIALLYEQLDRIAPSPLNTLNRSIAIAEHQGAEAGLCLLEALTPPAWLFTYYLWDATLGELYRRVGNADRARHHLGRALQAAPTNAERALLERRLSALTA